VNLRKLIPLLLKPKILYIKISRRINNKLHSINIRFNEYLKLDPEKILDNLSFDPLNKLSTKPGNPIFFNNYHNDINFYEVNDSANIFDHKIKIFSDKYFDVNLKNTKNLNQLLQICEELSTNTVNGYKPINWHCDFKSGYIWDDKLLYLDIPLLPNKKADIKIPRELSRFQHIGEIFFADRRKASDEFFMQIADWINSNPIRKGVNWACTMDVSIRAVNWIWGIRFFEKELENYPKLKKIIFFSLIEHAKHIYNNLEYYEECTGNHYLSNIVGLIYISSRIPEYKDSNLWLLFGMQELISEMDREVYDDGFSHEASTHYHRLVTEMFLSTSSLIERIPLARRKNLLLVDFKKHNIKPSLIDLEINKLNLHSSESILPPAFYNKLKLMIECISSTTKPNGLVPQIGDNDSARLHKLTSQLHQDYRNHSHILALGGEVFNNNTFRNIGSKSFKEADIIAGDYKNKHYDYFDSGFRHCSFFKDAGIGILKNNQTWLLVTCGTNGQNKRGGHGHNDKNSFELNIDGLDFIVDGGCPYYTSNPVLRNEYRSTFAHSTLAIECMEQDAWQDGISGLFSLEELCNPQLIKEGNIIRGSHKGYGEIHTREFKLNEHSLIINDCCKSKGIKYLLFNLDPKVEIKSDRIVSNIFSATLTHEKAKNVQIQITGIEESEITSGYFGKGFGIEVKNNMLKVKMSSESSKTTFSW
jgi:hypothetical protein